ncbi:phage/plasmid primase, P4 family [Candidatus Bathyarchaeota archaeon]|nr:phage/plasmid primase, P4 family [Candidatus Bathyarchaeota archaeon]
MQYQVAKWLRSQASIKISNEVIHNLKAKTSIPALPKLPLNLIPVQNGFIDADTKEIKPFTDECFNTLQLPVTYDPNADCPRFKKFLSEVQHEEDIEVSQEVFGDCLQRDYRYQKAICLLGEGANGKSVYINVLRALLGSANISNVSLQDVDNDRFAAASLYNKLANLYPDISSIALRQTGIFKALTGGDQIEAQFKYGQRFRFTNHAKLIFSANKIPETPDDSDAFYRRWIILHFPNQFLADNPKRDPKLLEKLATPEELSGVLNWAIEGLTRLNSQGQFSNGKSIEVSRTEYTRHSNSVKAFCVDCLEFDAVSSISKDELYTAYLVYCEENKIVAMAKNVFGRELYKFFGGLTETYHVSEEHKIAYWSGIRLKSILDSSTSAN